MLRVIVERWAEEASRQPADTRLEPKLEMASDFKKVSENLEQNLYWDKEDRTRARQRLRSLEAHLSKIYLEDHVKFVFCTLSTSAHPTLVEGFAPSVALIDEAAHEGIAGIAVVLGAFCHSINQVLFGGDQQQGEPIFNARDSNLGHNFVSKNIFAHLATDPLHTHPMYMLTECYRMPQELIKWSSKHCYEGKVVSAGMTANLELPLRNTLWKYWNQLLRSAMLCEVAQLAIDVSGPDAKEKTPAGTTTRVNVAEALEIARTVKEMLMLDPPQDTAQKKFRRIRGADIWHYHGVHRPSVGDSEATLPDRV
ncbi:hypothetical protein EJ04DRAFT_334947 [Polyplosphaeria fusca]|uniref:Uncharacterized protein n=1 Tax=Polyplosphaeria fusca TaxID=682080 RepID=A0A9P4RA43_9PLEO|nr:hypothetical protein EJ04DRAFT_334947 [Polyplosphaeria fusca]